MCSSPLDLVIYWWVREVTHASVEISQNSPPWYQTSLKWNGTLGLDWKHALLQNTFSKNLFFRNLTNTSRRRTVSLREHFAVRLVLCFISTTSFSPMRLRQPTSWASQTLRWSWGGTATSPKLLELLYCMQERELTEDMSLKSKRIVSFHWWVAVWPNLLRSEHTTHLWRNWREWDSPRADTVLGLFLLL